MMDKKPKVRSVPTFINRCRETKKHIHAGIRLEKSSIESRLELKRPSSNGSCLAASRKVDFQSKAAEVVVEVNDWANRRTNGIVEEIVPRGAVNNLTPLIYANALFFEGVWNQNFDASATKRYDFHLLNDGSVRVPFMTSEEDQYVSLTKELGLVLPFSNEADFTEMVEESSDDVTFSEVFHKSSVEVNGEGTEAGAASVTMMDMSSLGGYGEIYKHYFVADHPVLFFIKEDTTGTVLFSGDILDPSLPA